MQKMTPTEFIAYASEQLSKATTEPADHAKLRVEKLAVETKKISDAVIAKMDAADVEVFVDPWQQEKPEPTTIDAVAAADQSAKHTETIGKADTDKLGWPGDMNSKPFLDAKPNEEPEWGFDTP